MFFFFQFPCARKSVSPLLAALRLYNNKTTLIAAHIVVQKDTCQAPTPRFHFQYRYISLAREFLTPENTWGKKQKKLNLALCVPSVDGECFNTALMFCVCRVVPQAAQFERAARPALPWSCPTLRLRVCTNTTGRVRTQYGASMVQSERGAFVVLRARTIGESSNRIGSKTIAHRAVHTHTLFG